MGEICGTHILDEMICRITKVIQLSQLCIEIAYSNTT